LQVWLIVIFTKGLKRAMLPVPLMLVFPLSLGGRLNRCWSLSGLSPLRVYRPRARPLLLIGVYLQSGDAFAAASLLDSVLPWAASLGEDFCVLGDFNLPKTHWPTSSALAAGHLFDADEVAGDPAQLPGTRRNPDGFLTGTVIDYMLHSPALTVRSRVQVQAVADHDLVYYSLKVLGTVVGCGIRKNLVTPFPLAAVGPRAAPCEPHRRAPTYQSFLERRLRRLGRRAAEFTKDGDNQPLFNAIRRDVHALAADFPSLLAQPWGLEPAAQHTFALADQQADHDRAIRLQHWQATTGEDFTRLCQWVRATVPSHSPHRPDADEWTAPLHPQAQAEHAATTWGDLWAPANLPQPEGFAQMRALIGPTAEFPLPSITGAAIFARFKAACDRLADLWAACLQHEAMPQIWKHIRVCLLPKPDGGLRPISIASAAYRTCMTCLLRSCRAWFLSWADRELIGGIPGRHTGQAHDALFSALT
ncbi:unnamed protein product, partial [Symbiodinium necroappetens]